MNNSGRKGPPFLPSNGKAFARLTATNIPRRKKFLLAKVAILEILELSVDAESSPARSEVRTRLVATAPLRGGDAFTSILGLLDLDVGTSCGLLHDVNALPCVEINNSRKDERRIGNFRFNFMIIKNLCFRPRDNEVDVRAMIECHKYKYASLGPTVGGSSSSPDLVLLLVVLVVRTSCVTRRLPIE